MDNTEVGQALDRLSVAWDEAARYLKGKRCPLPVDASVGDDDVLSYRKHCGAWKVCILYEDEFRPIADCPTVDRLEMVQHFHLLVAAVDEAVAKLPSLVDEKVAALMAMIKADKVADEAAEELIPF